MINANRVGVKFLFLSTKDSVGGKNGPLRQQYLRGVCHTP